MNEKKNYTKHVIICANVKEAESGAAANMQLLWGRAKLIFTVSGDEMHPNILLSVPCVLLAFIV